MSSRSRPTLAASKSRLMRALALLALVVVVASSSIRAHASNPTLVARVGLHDAFTISLRKPSGPLVRSIPAGTYAIVVHDDSRLHNFALGSQTANRRIFTTGVPWVGTRTYTVKLVPGKYAYACSVHYQTMNGTFIVTK
jgi:hypothetical protein